MDYLLHLLVHLVTLADLGFFLEGVTLGTRASEALRGSGLTGE